LPIFILSYYVTEKNKGFKQFYKDGLQFLLLGFAINIFWIYANIMEHCNPIFPNLIKYLGTCKYPISVMTDVMIMVNESTFLQKGTSLAATHSISDYFPFFIEAAGLINSILIIFAIITFFIFRSKKKHTSKLDFFILWRCCVFLHSYIFVVVGI
jgi:4-amino-4-deoxy-L-arabinose transferase-like glycosyltransferase